MCKSVINNKTNQQNMLLTQVYCHFVTLISETQILSCQLPGRKYWSERFLLKVYIVVYYFSLIIFSTLELTSFMKRFARREQCSLLNFAEIIVKLPAVVAIWLIYMSKSDGL